MMRKTGVIQFDAILTAVKTIIVCRQVEADAVASTAA
jgi:hypothetical protein